MGFKVGDKDNKFKYWNNICELQQKQTKKGISKYGFTLEDSDNMPLLKTLTYLQEELIDGLMYIEHIKTLLEDKWYIKLKQTYKME